MSSLESPQLNQFINEIASLARLLKKELTIQLENKLIKTFHSKLKGIIFNFLTSLNVDSCEISLEGEIDCYVQSIIYALFFLGYNVNLPLGIDKIKTEIRSSKGTIKEFFETINDNYLPNSVCSIINDIIESINYHRYHSLNKDLQYSLESNFEYFPLFLFQKFLNFYDNKQKKEKSFFITPLPVVKFIIKNIDYILRNNFMKNGLDDLSVSLLDFTTGTGIFLIEALAKTIINDNNRTTTKSSSGKLFNPFLGFEISLPLVVISEFNINQFLKENKVHSEINNHYSLFLTNTLDGIEIRKFNTEKIWILVGNPPYSNYSSNNTPWIIELLNDYRKGMNEKKINLRDDYIKFIRFSHWKIKENNRGGIIGIITPNSYLDGITRRQMRKLLYEDMDLIYILNLHGSYKRIECDENIFGIKSGISISFFVRLPKVNIPKKIYYYSTLKNNILTKKEKYNFLLQNSIPSIKWDILSPKNPYFWFIEKNLGKKKFFDNLWGVKDIFLVLGSGIKTDRDFLFVDFNKINLIAKMKTLFTGNYSNEFKQKYKVENTSSYKIEERITKYSYNPNNIKRYLYRPFDFRYVYYQAGITSRPAFKIMKHFLGNKENLGLIFPRQVVIKEWNHVFLTNMLADVSCISNKTREGSFIAPMFLIDLSSTNNSKILPNFTKKFTEFINTQYKNNIPPKQVFSYIYAFLHSNYYKGYYSDLLKLNYPKIPFIKSEITFFELSRVGIKLMDLHLNNNFENKLSLRNYYFPILGDNRIEFVNYEEKKERIYINKTQYFQNIPNEFWLFTIGSYRLLESWLKSRKEKSLYLQEILQFIHIIISIRKTLMLIVEIDRIIENYYLS